MQGFGYVRRKNPADRGRKGISYMMRQNSYRRITGFFTKTSIVLALILGALLFFLITFRLDTITVIGSNYYSEQELADRMTDSPLDSNTLLFYLTHCFGEQKRIPYIEQIDYTIIDSHTIEAQVYEKILVGCVKVMGQYMYFDKDGYVTDSTQDRLSQVPCITGLEFDRILLHEKLEIQKDSLYDTMLNLTKLLWDYELPVDTIEFSAYDEVTLYIDNIKVLLGKHDMYDEAISALSGVFVATKENDLAGREMTIDMRKYEAGTEVIVAKPVGE